MLSKIWIGSILLSTVAGATASAYVLTHRPHLASAAPLTKLQPTPYLESAVVPNDRKEHVYLTPADCDQINRPYHSENIVKLQERVNDTSIETAFSILGRPGHLAHTYIDDNGDRRTFYLYCSGVHIHILEFTNGIYSNVDSSYDGYD